MEHTDLPGWLLTLEAVVAGLLVLLSLWPWAREGRALVAELRLADRWVGFCLVAAVSTGLALRAAAEPTLLYAPNEAFAHIDKLFWPIESSRWHVHAGTGGYLLVAGLASLFGRSIDIVVALNVAAGGLSILLIYAFSLRAFRDRLTAALAATLFALYLPQIRVDASEQLATLTIAYSLLAYVTVLRALDEPSRESFLSAAIAAAAAVQMRPGAILHVAGAGLLYVALACGRPRAFARWFWWSLGIFAMLVAPRALVALHATTSSLGGHRLRVDVLWDVFTSWRHVYANPSWSAPVYPALSVLGLAALAATRQLRLLLVLVVVWVLGCLLYFNEWLLDLNDALRFEAPTWFLLVALAGLGLAALVHRIQVSLLRKGIITGSIGIAAAWILVGRSLIFTPLVSDQDLQFFSAGLSHFPVECRLYTLETRDLRTGYYGPRFRPDWLFRAQARDQPIFPYPEALELPLSQGCHVAYLGAECYRWYIDDRTAPEKIKHFYALVERPPLYALVDDFLTSEDQRARPDAMRPECMAVIERFELEPIVTTDLPPGRSGSRIWSPNHPLKVGFYRLGLP
jgi:hypothetical protein